MVLHPLSLKANKLFCFLPVFEIKSEFYQAALLPRQRLGISRIGGRYYPPALSLKGSHWPLRSSLNRECGTGAHLRFDLSPAKSLFFTSLQLALLDFGFSQNKLLIPLLATPFLRSSVCLCQSCQPM